jgi:hypothetical protein
MKEAIVDQKECGKKAKKGTSETTKPKGKDGGGADNDKEATTPEVKGDGEASPSAKPKAKGKAKAASEVKAKRPRSEAMIAHLVKIKEQIALWGSLAN